MSDPQLDLVYVKTHPDEGDRVGLSEKHPQHPRTAQFPEGGEAFVARQDQEPQQVARTGGVLEALARKRIVEATAPAARTATTTTKSGAG